MARKRLNGLSGRGCTPRGSCNCTLLRRVPRRFSNSKCFLEGVLRLRLARVSIETEVLRRVLRRGGVL